MLQGIDHIVIAVVDLAVASRNYEGLGFTVVPGGRHPVGTHNALIAFADGAYIELIAFYEKNTQHKWWEPLQQGGGLVDFCMQTDDLMADTAAFRKAAVDIDAPDGARSPLKSWLATRGASPYAATLWTRGARGGLLDESKTLGARLALA